LSSEALFAAGASEPDHNPACERDSYNGFQEERKAGLKISIEIGSEVSS
jgi:hypothetical protein